jgi:hypothetical protein
MRENRLRPKPLPIRQHVQPKPSFEFGSRDRLRIDWRGDAKYSIYPFPVSAAGIIIRLSIRIMVAYTIMCIRYEWSEDFFFSRISCAPIVRDDYSVLGTTQGKLDLRYSRRLYTCVTAVWRMLIQWFIYFILFFFFFFFVVRLTIYHNT